MPRRNKRRFCTVIDMCRIVVKEHQSIKYRNVTRFNPATAIVEVQDFTNEDFAYFSINDGVGVPEPKGNWTVMDAYTASAIVQVYDAVKDDGKMRLNALEPLKLANVVWATIERAKERAKAL